MTLPPHDPDWLTPEKRAEWEAMDTDASWKTLRARVSPAAVVPSRPSRPVYWRITGFAAAAAIIVAAGIVVLRYRDIVGAGREYRTAAGQVETVTLPDGSRFTLGPASRLRLAADYGKDRRDISLVEGEAYFAVAHDARHPFAVHTHDVVATDIGTHFDVRAYALDRTIRVAVVEGEVLVGAGRGVAQARRAPPAQADLTAGAVAIVDSSIAIAHGADVAELTAWTQGRLVFDAAPLPVVLADLSRWYGVDVRVGDRALNQRHITATIDQPSISAVLDLLVPTVGARYEHRGSRYTLFATSPKEQ